jgi:hypothetical protein
MSLLPPPLSLRAGNAFAAVADRFPPSPLPFADGQPARRLSIPVRSCRPPVRVDMAGDTVRVAPSAERVLRTGHANDRGTLRLGAFPEGIAIAVELYPGAVGSGIAPERLAFVVRGLVEPAVFAAAHVPSLHDLHGPLVHAERIGLAATLADPEPDILDSSGTWYVVRRPREPARVVHLPGGWSLELVHQCGPRPSTGLHRVLFDGQCRLRYRAW